MKEESDIRRYTAAELRGGRARGESKTDLAALDAKTEEQLEADIAGDPDFADIPSDWYLAAEAVMPHAKKMLTLRLDADVVDWFRARGPGYQTRINAVLKAFVHHKEKPKIRKKNQKAGLTIRRLTRPAAMSRSAKGRNA